MYDFINYKCWIFVCCWCTCFDTTTLVNRHIDVLRCHHFIEDGVIRFLGDCDHAMKHKVVDLVGVSF